MGSFQPQSLCVGIYSEGALTIGIPSGAVAAVESCIESKINLTWQKSLLSLIQLELIAFASVVVIPALFGFHHLEGSLCVFTEPFHVRENFDDWCTYNWLKGSIHVNLVTFVKTTWWNFYGLLLVEILFQILCTQQLNILITLNWMNKRSILIPPERFRNDPKSHNWRLFIFANTFDNGQFPIIMFELSHRQTLETRCCNAFAIHLFHPIQLMQINFIHHCHRRSLVRE